MKNQVQNGDMIDVAAPAGGTTSGAGVLVGTALFGVAANTVAAGAQVSIAVNKVWDLAKVSAMAFAVGDLVYWDNTAKLCTNVSSANTKIGVAVAAAANPSATVRVRLTGQV